MNMENLLKSVVIASSFYCFMMVLSVVEADEGLPRSQLTDEFLPLDTVRDKVVEHLWHEQASLLDDFIKRHPVETMIFVEKCIEEIEEGNEFNQLLFYLADQVMAIDKGLPVFQMQLEGKIPIVFGESGVPPDRGRESLALVVDLRNDGDDLTFNQFEEIIEEMLSWDFYNQYGLPVLVRKNPGWSKQFVRDVVEGLQELPTDSKLHEALCYIGLYYRNHYHSYELLELVDGKFGGVGDFLEREGEHHTGSVMMASGGRRPWDFLEEGLGDVRPLLVANKYQPATEQLELYSKYADIILGGKTVFGGEGDSAYNSIYLFNGIVHLRLGNSSAAEEILQQYGAKGYGYADLFLGCEDAISAGKDRIDMAFSALRTNDEFHIDDFVFELTGFRYGETARSYSMLKWDLKETAESDGPTEGTVLFKMRNAALGVIDAIGSRGSTGAFSFECSLAYSNVIMLNMVLEERVERSLSRELRQLPKIEMASYFEREGFFSLIIDLYEQMKLDPSMSPRDVAEVGNKAGVAFLRSGKPKRALAVLEESRIFFVDSYQNDGDQDALEYLAALESNIGSAFNLEGRRVRAVELFQSSMRRLEELNMRYGTLDELGEMYSNVRSMLISTTNSVGADSLANGDGAIALRYFLKALETLGDPTTEAEEETLLTIYNNVGAAHKALGDSVEARKWLQKVVVHLGASGDEPVLCYTFGHLCSLDLASGDHGRGVGYCLKGLGICENHDIAERGCLLVDSLSAVESQVLGGEVAARLKELRMTFACDKSSNEAVSPPGGA